MKFKSVSRHRKKLSSSSLELVKEREREKWKIFEKRIRGSYN